ncbi:hypothetical protein [Alienimonas californiensis]|uniref:Uncharacterized protein n=1 Tax=Alienimonas californiensis TaxID=2527989 RepID=A0A517PC08_9PLAN|nr:hypothetical protein [Alienimonas californiensis]QDT16889.1 hypothetical protein CA12_29970 [Alienimonas californiensis]
MSFLTEFLKTRGGGPDASAPSSFGGLSDEQLERHLKVAKYGDFTLTDAVRPAYDLRVVPKAGYRRDHFVDSASGVRVPVLMASASREVLFEVFLDLLDPLGDEVDVVLESSHSAGKSGHRDLVREGIDLPVLKSALYDFEEEILDDGCLGIAVLNAKVPLEVQFDEHKLLVMYGQDLFEFEKVLFEHRLTRDDGMKFVTEAEHVHSSTDELAEAFSKLSYEISAEA